MKKIVLVVLMLAYASAAHAGLNLEGKRDRQGFFIGFGLGGGAMLLTGSGASETKAAFLGDLRIGGGLNDKILLMYDGSTDYTRADGINFNVYHNDFAAQFFVWEDFFLRPSLGAVIARASTSVGGTTVAVDGKWSLGGSLATGYEFRFGKYFALSPELLYRYAHIRGNGGSGNTHSFGAQAGMSWYF